MTNDNVKLEEIIQISDDASKKWRGNYLGLAVETLGMPSNVEKINKEYFNAYVLEWKYNEYTIKIDVYDGEYSTPNSIGIEIISNNIL